MTEKPQAAEKPDWWERASAVIDPERPAFVLHDDLLQDVWQHARECYPEEACGLLLGPADQSEPSRIERCRNVQNRRKQAGESHLDARHGFWIDEKELLDALKRADQSGHQLKLIYHSHVDTGAYLSHTDREAALSPQGEPLWPGVGHLIVGVREDGVTETGVYFWDPAAEIFVGSPVGSTDS